MLIVVSGTHASGKSSLIGDFSSAHPDVEVWPDPIEELGEYPTDPGAGVFFQQLQVAAARLLAPVDHSVIAERGPLDFLAYLEAADRLGRPVPSSDHLRRGAELCAAAMRHADLLVLLPLDPTSPIDVPPDEDPELREVMDEVLLELSDDTDLTGGTEVVELTGPPEVRLAALRARVDVRDK
ncbi:AAA family ATPase [Nocardioides sp. WV_118_6]|uniref:AAA family ATPase n=1 Tax=Nocardioides simplex TaxID=2045 RepID=UPI00214FEBBE|nr:AAA family ATPase [Pimelobacter simplex]UUW91486.1 AAA family ATPase [Pimelobacter simplex]UUW95314.1 AAA family ATPase [Pimelobacter simplex]